MKILAVGGNGLVGSKAMEMLRAKGHDVTAASPRSGVNSVTGEGLDAALKGVDVVIDVTNSPSFEDKAVLEFFEQSTTNLLAAEERAGVKHHLAISIVGAEQLPDSGYMRAKVAQEKLIKQGKIPYTIIRATQFFEFLGGIAQEGATGSKTRLSTGDLQAVAAIDVSTLVAEQAVKPPINGTIELAGPEALPLCEFVEKYLKATGDKMEVIPDPEARYFGTKLQKNSLTPVHNPIIGKTSFADWIKNQTRTPV